MAREGGKPPIANLATAYLGTAKKVGGLKILDASGEGHLLDPLWGDLTRGREGDTRYLIY